MFGIIYQWEKYHLIMDRTQCRGHGDWHDRVHIEYLLVLRSTIINMIGERHTPQQNIPLVSQYWPVAPVGLWQFGTVPVVPGYLVVFFWMREFQSNIKL